MKSLKIFLAAIVIIILLVLIFNQVKVSQCILNDKISSDRYFWLFDGSVTNNLRIEDAAGNIKNSKFRFLYNYKNLYRYLIVEDEKFDKVLLDEIEHLQIGLNPNKMSITSSEGFETWERKKHVSITSNLCTDQSDKLTLNFNKEAKIWQYDSLNRLLLKGKFESLLIKNENSKIQYLIKYDKETTSEIIFYKPKDRLYLILVIPFSDEIELGKGVDNLNFK